MEQKPVRHSVRLILSQSQQALLERARLLHQEGNLEGARTLYRKLEPLQPHNAELFRLLGTVEYQLGDREACLRALQKSLELDSLQPHTHYNLGIVLHELGRYWQAVDQYDQALAIKGDYAEAYYNRGNSLLELRQLEEACVSYAKALAINPNHRKAFYNRASTLNELGDCEQAIVSFEKLLATDPDYAFVLAETLNAQAYIGKWDHFESRRSQLVEQISRRQIPIYPFFVLGLIDSPELHRIVAETYVSQKGFAADPVTRLEKHARHGRIRIGYFSSDFHDHPVAHLMAGVFGHHDRSRFETFAFSLGRDRQDPWRERVSKAVDHFIDVQSNSALEIARLARSHEIDIAIDLNGFTRGSRAGIFAERAAPVQASYIGYLGTMGAPYIDYLIADPIIIPEDKRSFYAEKIVSLPSYQANDDRMPISERVFTRAEIGLPEQAFVFCSFNTTYKVTPEVFDSWMRILKSVPGSVLWLHASHPDAIPNFKHEADARGVSSERLVFAERIPLAEHLARQRLADLFLDTHPYNAGATASNALRVGLPVLTRLGEAFPARMGASIVTAAGVPELITHSVEEYEALAVALATDRERLSAIRQTLMASLPTCALFDTARFTRSLEAAYAAMYERCQNDLPPDHLHIEVATSR